jgi:hypothetical protein
MIPLLTRYGAKLAAVIVLALGAVIGIQIATDDPAELDAKHPSQAAAQQQARAEEAYEAVRYKHANYIAETAGADAATKAEAVADYAASKAEALDKAEKDAQAAAEERAREEARRSNPNPTSVTIPGSCNEFSGNRATGCAMTLDYGWDLEQFACLEKLWTKESGWNHLAANGIGAYGIPQALPGSKMATTGSDWETNPVTQIKWGLGYIDGRYGAPCSAWAHSQANNWY